jgi:hypothetical protein
MQATRIRRLPDVKRDLELVREIIKMIEEDPEADNRADVRLDIPGRTDEEMAYHLDLLLDAGFINARPEDLIVNGLTWKGHEFLDNIRNDTFWNKAKHHFSSLPSVGLGIIASYIEAEIKKYFGVAS